LKWFISSAKVNELSLVRMHEYHKSLPILGHEIRSSSVC
jgi:hypothetical protein